MPATIPGVRVDCIGPLVIACWHHGGPGLSDSLPSLHTRVHEAHEGIQQHPQEGRQRDGHDLAIMGIGEEAWSVRGVGYLQSASATLLESLWISLV